MAAWQIIAIAFVALLPFALLIDLHPHRERLSARGAPLQRDWRRQLEPSLGEDDHH
jgi:hypothetical protein